MSGMPPLKSTSNPRSTREASRPLVGMLLVSRELQQRGSPGVFSNSEMSMKEPAGELDARGEGER